MNDVDQLNLKQRPIGNTCRTCGTTAESDAEFTHLFTSASAVSKEIVHLLHSLEFKFNENDGLPKKMCKNCLKTFAAFSEFRKHCEKVQERLLAVFSLQFATDPATSNLAEVPKAEFKQEEDLVIIEDLHDDFLLSESDNENSDCENKTQSKTTLDSDNLPKDEMVPKGSDWKCEYVLNSDSDTDDGEMEETEKGDVRPGVSKLESSTRNQKQEKSNKVHIKGLFKDIERKETCPYCHNKFARVRLHIQLCPKVIGKLCKYCTRRFESDEELEEHIDTMHSEGQPACPICFCSFQTFNQRTNHMRKIHERGLTKCEICNIDFHSKYYLIKHNKKEHIAVVNRECPECKKVLKTEYTYERHMKAHTDEKLFQCKHCGKGFMQPRNMRIHEAKHTGPVERSFLCDMCGESFLGFTHLRVHQGKKHAIEVSKAYQKRSYICPVCGKGFSYKGLENHFNKHTEEEKKASPLIRYPVKVGTTKIVRSTSTRSKKATFKCTLCPRFFATTYGLEQHLQRHVEKRPFNCTECGNGFKRITHLKAHVRRIHRKEKRCVCLKCGKGFSENYELLCHQRVHEENYPYKCNQCPAAYRWLPKLRAHTRQHSNEKPYICRICGKRYASCSTLKNHSLTHSAAELKNLNEQLVSMYEQEMDDLAANDVENHQPNDEEPKGSKTDSQEASFSNQEDKMSIFEDDDILA